MPERVGRRCGVVAAHLVAVCWAASLRWGTEVAAEALPLTASADFLVFGDAPDLLRVAAITRCPLCR